MGHGRQVTFTTFVATAQARMSSVTDLVSRMQGKYDEVLDYFGEDPGMAYDVFFKTLHVFVGAFEHARKEVDEAKRQEVPHLLLPLPLPLPLLPPLLPRLAIANKPTAAPPRTDIASTTTVTTATTSAGAQEEACAGR